MGYRKYPEQDFLFTLTKPNQMESYPQMLLLTMNYSLPYHSYHFLPQNGNQYEKLLCKKPPSTLFKLKCRLYILLKKLPISQRLQGIYTCTPIWLISQYQKPLGVQMSLVECSLLCTDGRCPGQKWNRTTQSPQIDRQIDRYIVPQ